MRSVISKKLPEEIGSFEAEFPSLVPKEFVIDMYVSACSFQEEIVGS